MSPDHVVGGVLRMPDFSLDMLIVYTSIKKQSAHDLCELLPLAFEDMQKLNPTAAMEIRGGWLLEM